MSGIYRLKSVDGRPLLQTRDRDRAWSVHRSVAWSNLYLDGNLLATAKRGLPEPRLAGGPPAGVSITLSDQDRLDPDLLTLGDADMLWTRPARLSVADRFWLNVAKSKDGCWLWTASVDSGGYGVFDTGRRSHRYSWELHHGPIPPSDGLIVTCVCHHCDNPRCVRPDHLFLGTQGDNMRDMAEKGRGARHAGESNPRAKLTAAIVRSIRARVA